MSERVRFLSLDDLLAVSAAALDEEPQIRDWGLLQSALMRPQALVFGLRIYADVPLAAAALIHSLARNVALVDGNKRTALGALWLFLALNGMHLGGTDDERYDLIIQVAIGELPDVALIVDRLAALVEPL